MPTPHQRKHRLTLLLFLSILAMAALSIAYAVLHGGPWVVPEEAKRLKNPLTFSQTSLAAARSTYRDLCVECHGDSGRGDGPKASTFGARPSDLTDARHFDAVTDGEIFYKITHGRRPMPGFQKRLSETQRWQLVLLIRALSYSSSRSISSPNHKAQ